MKFLAQLKEVSRKSTVSNDVEYRIVLITDENLKELMDIQADENVVVEIKEDK